MVLQGISLQEGLDQAMVLEPFNDSLDRIIAKQLQVSNAVDRQTGGCDKPPVKGGDIGHPVDE